MSDSFHGLDEEFERRLAKSYPKPRYSDSDLESLIKDVGYEYKNILSSDLSIRNGIERFSNRIHDIVTRECYTLIKVCDDGLVLAIDQKGKEVALPPGGWSYTNRGQYRPEPTSGSICRK